jgi:hypothetical protein
MISYIPFLKAKRGEFNALGQLPPTIRKAICPFLDFPRRKPPYDSADFITTVGRIARGLQKHWGHGDELYFDDLDLDQAIDVNGLNQYAYILQALSALRVIPVVSILRAAHNDSVRSLKRFGALGSETVAFRVFKDDFEDFDATRGDIAKGLHGIFGAFGAIDLVFDCRLCTGLDASETGAHIAKFAGKFCTAYPQVRRLIVTGSSIPASLSVIVDTNSTRIVPRNELNILRSARVLAAMPVVAGDYATVSPFYSDADIKPELLPTVTAPKLVYSFGGSHYIARGVSLKSGGPAQYIRLTRELCQSSYFRGRDYSKGEAYFEDKSKRIGNHATNGTVVTPSVISHVTYTVGNASA